MKRQIFFQVAAAILTIFANISYGGWVKVGVPQNGTQTINALAVGGNNIFAGTDSGVFISTDTGVSWSLLSNSPKNVLSLCYGGPPIFAGTMDNGLFASYNSGNSWSSSGFSGNLKCIYSLSSSGGLLSGSDSGVWCGTSTGTYGDFKNIGLKNLKVNALTVVGHNNNKYDIFAGTDTGIFFTPNFQATTPIGPVPTWSATNNGLPNLHINALAVNGNIQTATAIFAGLDYGVYLSQNGGGSWTEFNDGLTDKYITSSASSNIYLFAGTITGNVAKIWRRPLSEITLVTTTYKSSITPTNIIIANNGQLKYFITDKSDLSVKLYDIKGRIIFSTNIDRQPPGCHILQLAVANLSSGNYILDFHTGICKVEKRFSIIR